MGSGGLLQFLDHVVRSVPDPLPVLEQARSALASLHAEVLGVDLEIPQPRPARLLDQVRQEARPRHRFPRTQDCYPNCVKRYILIHGKRYPRELAWMPMQKKNNAPTRS
jgi:hypothetical protein